jgi:hypothetical protein
MSTLKGAPTCIQEEGGYFQHLLYFIMTYFFIMTILLHKLVADDD